MQGAHHGAVRDQEPAENRYYHDTTVARDIWGFISCAKEMTYETARIMAEAFEAEGLILDIVRVH